MIDFGTRAGGQRLGARNEVFIPVCLENMPDHQPFLLSCLQVLLMVELRVDHGGVFPCTNQIGKVSKAGRLERFEDDELLLLIF